MTWQQQAGGEPTADAVEQALRSARRAGTFLIVSRQTCPHALAALAREGLVRERIGHLVLTLAGEQRRRIAGRRAA